MYVHVAFTAGSPVSAKFDPEIVSAKDPLPIRVNCGNLSVLLSLTEARELATQLENAAAQVSVARARNLPRDEDD